MKLFDFLRRGSNSPIKKQDFSGIVGDPEYLMTQLVKEGYIDSNGIIQDAFTKIPDSSKMSLHTAYDHSKMEIYLVLRKHQSASVTNMQDKKYVRGLIKDLRHKDFQKREKAASTLGMMADFHEMKTLITVLAPKPLIRALKDSKSDVRYSAAIALGEIGDTRAVKPLITILKHASEKWTVRSAAAKALGKIGDARAVEPLMTALKDSDSKVHTWAADALIRFDDFKAKQSILEYEREKKELKESKRQQEEKREEESKMTVLHKSGNIVRNGYGFCAMCGKKIATDISLTSHGALICNICGLSICWVHDKKQIINQKCPKCGAIGMWQTHTAVYQ